MNPERQAVIEAQLAREQAWAYDQRVVAGLPYNAIRSLAVRPPELGGIGRTVSIAALRGMVDAFRVAQGDVIGTRAERIERRQLEIDALAQGARESWDAARELGTIDIHAAKLLLEARAQEAKMHGDDEPEEIVVHHRDAVLDELNASLAAMGEKPVERIEQ